MLLLTLRSTRVYLTVYLSMCQMKLVMESWKYWNKFRYSCIQCFFFLWQYNYNWERHHLFLEWLWVVEDSYKFALDKNRKLYVQIHHVANSMEKFFWHPPTQQLRCSRLCVTTVPCLTIISSHILQIKFL